VFGNNVVDSGIPVEVWRYYLLSIRPETSDAQFTWDGFVAANNNELLANLGNFVNRLSKFINTKYGGVIPNYRHGEEEETLKKDVNVLLQNYISCLESVKIRQGLKIAMEISARGNQYLQDNKIDNTLFAEKRQRCDSVVATAASLCYLLSALVYPYMPTTSDGILRILNLPNRKITTDWSGDDILCGHQIGHAEYLFKRIDDKKIDECRKLYSSQKSAAKAPIAKPSKVKKTSKQSDLILPPNPTPEMISVNDKIIAQGLLVRKLKAEKVSPAEITVAVNALLSLKKELSDLIS
jgi:methionyl-tRNA synthetase